MHYACLYPAQVLVEGKPGQTGDDLERELFILRKLVEKAKAAQMPAEFAPDFYICTLSNRTIVYKVWGRLHGQKDEDAGIMGQPGILQCLGSTLEQASRARP